MKGITKTVAAVLLIVSIALALLTIDAFFRWKDPCFQKVNDMYQDCSSKNLQNCREFKDEQMRKCWGFQ